MRAGKKQDSFQVESPAKDSRKVVFMGVVETASSHLIFVFIFEMEVFLRPEMD